jgi:hypothetical protein
VNPVLIAAGALMVAGGIASVTARRPSLVAIGVAAMLGGSPLLVQPLPGSLLLTEQAIGALLAGELLWLGLRGRTVAGASALGWPSMALLAIAAFAAGYGAQRLAPGAGPAEALGTAVALAAIAIIALAGRPDGTQMGLSALVLVNAAAVMRLALSGPPSALGTLLAVALAAAVAAAVALLAPRPQPAPTTATAFSRSAIGTLVRGSGDPARNDGSAAGPAEITRPLARRPTSASTDLAPRRPDDRR